MLEVRRAGLYAHYRRADPEVFRLWQAVRALGEARFLEVQEAVRTYFHERERPEAVAAEELARRLDEGRGVVLDVRPSGEYEAGHMTGVVSIPVEELSRRLEELPRSKEVVAHCRGPCCVQSDQAVGQFHHANVALPGWLDWSLRIVILTQDLFGRQCQHADRAGGG